MARLDHIYLNCHPADQEELQPMTGAAGFGGADWCSDHARVFPGLGARLAPRHDHAPSRLVRAVG
eukprot:5989453-Pyramimonas_sp.AAC.1